jgi:hypothetical protein
VIAAFLHWGWAWMIIGALLALAGRFVIIVWLDE